MIHQPFAFRTLNSINRPLAISSFTAVPVKLSLPQIFGQVSGADVMVGAEDRALEQRVI